MSDERPTPFTGSVADILDHYHRFGALPFPISGGDGSDENPDEEPEDEGKDDKAEETPEQKLEKTLAKVREAEKTANRELKKAQKRVQELENAGKPDTDKAAAAIKQAEADRDEALTKLQTANGKSAVIAAAVTAESPKPDVVYKLIKGDLEFDDDGEATNVAELIAQAKKDAPELFRKQTGKGNGGNRDEKTPSGKGQMNALLRRQAGRSAED